MEATNRRWSTDDIEDVTTAFRHGMASAIWEDGLVSMREEAYSSDGTEYDIDEAKNDDPPDAAFDAADALISLYAAANSIGDPSTPDEATLEVMNDAAEETDWRRVDELADTLNSVPFVFAMRASSAAGVPYGTIFARGAAGERDVETLGHYMYMEAVGHGVSWSDSHPKFKHDRAQFECNMFLGDTGEAYLTWSGSEKELRVSGEAPCGWNFSDDDDEVEAEDPATAHRIAVSFAIVDPETGEEVERGWAQDPGNGAQDGEILNPPDEDETWADVAAKFIQDTAAGVEPSDSTFQANRTWYSETDGVRIDNEQHQYLSFFLRNFTVEEQQAVYALLAS